MGTRDILTYIHDKRECGELGIKLVSYYNLYSLILILYRKEQDFFSCVYQVSYDTISVCFVVNLF